MVQQVQSIESGIPTALEPFYTGTSKEGQTLPGRGLIPLSYEAFFPEVGGVKQFGPQAYQTIFKPVQEAGLLGAGAIAPMSQFQQVVGQRLASMEMPQQFQLGTEAGQQAAAGLQALQGVQAMGVAAPDLTTYQMGTPTNVTAPGLTQFQLGPARQFSAAEAQQYMSPYFQTVVDAQQRAAIDAAKRAQLGQNLAAARQGTYGGARQTLLQGERESGLRTQLGDIQARGLQDAYTQAQAQFERDRAAQAAAEQQNLAAKLGVQQLGSGQTLQAALANQQAGLTSAQQNLQAALGVQSLGAGQSLEAQRANQQAALQAAQQRQAASQGLAGLASTFGGLGTQQLAGTLDVTKTLGAYGDLQRGITQQALDAQRGALMDQALYGQTQVGQLSNLLRGIPTTTTSQTTTTPPPSFASQLTGLGLTGLSLYNMLGGGK